jgi:hypothetical protein
MAGKGTIVVASRAMFAPVFAPTIVPRFFASAFTHAVAPTVEPTEKIDFRPSPGLGAINPLRCDV